MKFGVRDAAFWGLVVGFAHNHFFERRGATRSDPPDVVDRNRDATLEEILALLRKIDKVVNEIMLSSNMELHNYSKELHNYTVELHEYSMEMIRSRDAAEDDRCKKN